MAWIKSKSLYVHDLNEWSFSVKYFVLCQCSVLTTYICNKVSCLSISITWQVACWLLLVYWSSNGVSSWTNLGMDGWQHINRTNFVCNSLFTSHVHYNDKITFDQQYKYEQGAKIIYNYVQILKRLKPGKIFTIRNHCSVRDNLHIHSMQWGIKEIEPFGM